MADSKISALPAATVPLAGTEVLPIVQSSTTKQVSVANLTAGRAVSASSVTNAALTSGRVTFAGASGLLTDSANLTFDGNTLTSSNAAGAAGLIVNSSANTPYIRFDQSNAAKLTIGASAIVGGGVGYDFYGPAGIGLSFFTNAAERLRISTAGIVTMSAYGAGAATFSAAGVISSVSDETWKVKDGVPTNPDVMLQKLEPGYWFYNDEKAPIFGQDRQLGFYAQNVHEAIGEEAAPTPETYIAKDEEGNETSATKPWGYYDRSVLAVAVMSLKNALSTIEDLKQRIATLESNAS